MEKPTIDHQQLTGKVTEQQLYQFDTFIVAVKTMQEELKNFISGIGKELNDLIEADHFPDSNSPEARRRMQESFEFMLEVAWKNELFLEHLFLTYSKELIEKLNEANDDKIKAEFDKDLQQRLYNLLQSTEIQKMGLIREIIRLQAELVRLQVELQQAYLNLSSAVLTAFDKMLETIPNRVITIPELGKLQFNSHDMIRYIGNELAYKISRGEIKANELDKGIEDAKLKFIHSIAPDIKNKPTEIQDRVSSQLNNLTTEIKQYISSNVSVQNSQAAVAQLDAKLINTNKEVHDKEKLYSKLAPDKNYLFTSPTNILENGRAGQNNNMDINSFPPRGKMIIKPGGLGEISIINAGKKIEEKSANINKSNSPLDNKNISQDAEKDEIKERTTRTGRRVF